MSKTLIVAFDGLDHAIIQAEGCTTFTEMEEFGRIDNTNPIGKRVTLQLFAAFITGTFDNGVSHTDTYYPASWRGRIAHNI